MKFLAFIKLYQRQRSVLLPLYHRTLSGAGTSTATYVKVSNKEKTCLTSVCILASSCLLLSLFTFEQG